MNEKYLKVLFGNESHAGNKVTKFNIDKVTVADNWNPEVPDLPGGYCFSDEKNIARWLVRGDTLYDVILPDDAEIIKVNSPSTPDGVFKTNKIIITNPRRVTEELALELYRKSSFPEKTYFKTIAGYAVRGHIDTAKEIIKDKINPDNINLALSEINDFYKPTPGKPQTGSHEGLSEIINILLTMKKQFDKDE